MIRFSSQPFGDRRLGDFLRINFAEAKWTQFRAAVAFVRRSGVKHIRPALTEFSTRSDVRVVVGIDRGGTTREGLHDLLSCVEDRGEVWVCHNADREPYNPTFHPKLYLFRNDTEAAVYVGSGNLTEGGLYTNYEAGIVAGLDLVGTADRPFLAAVEAALDSWSVGGANPGTSKVLTPELLDRLVAGGYVPTEDQVRRSSASGGRTGGASGERIFGSVPPPPAPPVPPDDEPDTADADLSPPPGALAQSAPPPGAIPKGFVMTLQRTDVGVGQTTAGTQRRSPEIFIPKQVVLPVRNRRVQVCNPAFWEWPTAFTPDAMYTGPTDNGVGKHDRHMTVSFEGRNLGVTMWYNPGKRDFRVRAEDLRNAGQVGDLFRVERNAGNPGIPYTAFIIRPGDPDYAMYLGHCIHQPPNSRKEWGYYF